MSLQIQIGAKNSILRKISSEIKDFKEAKKIEKLLKDSLWDFNDIWVWLASPQIWINKRVFISKPDKKKIITFVNPRILSRSNDLEIDQEWCLSIPWIWWDVERAIKIQVEYYTVKWEKIVINLEWFPAKVFQHEYDHLDWILFIDKVVWDLTYDEWVDFEKILN